MASTSNFSQAQKRPHPDDDQTPNDEQPPEPKRSRSNNGSPAPQSNGAAGAPDMSAILAAARARREAIQARLAGSSPASAAGTTAPPPTTAPATAQTGSSASDRLAALKARVAAATSKLPSSQAPARAAPTQATYTPPVYEDGPSRARGGLDVGLHPALMADGGKDARSGKGQSLQPRFSTTMGNRRVDSGSRHPKLKVKNQLDLSGPSLEEIQSNPYFDATLGTNNVTGRARRSRQLLFNEKGKYTAQAAALRRQAALEAMKKRIAEQARKAGIDEDLDADKAFLVDGSVDIEWWDEGLVNGPNYDNIDKEGGLKIDTEDSIITRYIQHPVPLEPPQDKHAIEPKPLPLTAHEQAKKRRQERAANMKEQQAKVRLGLEPAPPPKVKLGNMMRVLGEEAVKDPTAVEARVNREIAERKQTHEDANQARKLTKEQRHEKIEHRQQKDADRGIFASVYKIDCLANGRHRFKISKNAEQMALTGVCILNPKFCLVIVEGGQKGIRDYKKLMINRIKWDENDAPNREVREGNNQAMASWLSAEDDNGQLKDLSSNKCRLIWEGQERQRAFRKWGSRQCETDKDAREQLQRANMELYWNMAKNWPDDEF